MEDFETPAGTHLTDEMHPHRELADDDALTDGPLQLLSALRQLDSAKGLTDIELQAAPSPLALPSPEDVFRLETYDRLRSVDRIHDVHPERLPRYEQADGPGDYLHADRQLLLERCREAILDRRKGDRMWRIVERHFGLGDRQPETLQAIGCAEDLTRERVRQIIEEALMVMRKVVLETDTPAPQGRSPASRPGLKASSTMEWKPQFRLRCA
jgi:hypothetical protein